MWGPTINIDLTNCLADLVTLISDSRQLWASFTSTFAAFYVDLMRYLKNCMAGQ